jgi:hypothetical protein
MWVMGGEKMRQRCIAAALLVISLTAVAQENSVKPKMSDAPLTTEQIAVYRAVLRDYLKGSDGALNLANITEPIDDSDKACFRGIDAGVIKESASVIHRIEPSVVANTKIVLVDSDRQQKTIKVNDPQNLIKKTIDDRQKLTDDQLDQSVKSAFGGALFELSEIVFDKEHRRAVVAYSFVCGELCGNGNTLVLKKVGKGWKLEKRCGGWVS